MHFLQRSPSNLVILKLEIEKDFSTELVKPQSFYIRAMLKTKKAQYLLDIFIFCITFTLIKYSVSEFYENIFIGSTSISKKISGHIN